MSKLNINPEHLTKIAAAIYEGSVTLAVSEATLLILQSQKVADEYNDSEEQKEKQV